MGLFKKPEAPPPPAPAPAPPPPAIKACPPREPTPDVESCSDCSSTTSTPDGVRRDINKGGSAAGSGCDSSVGQALEASSLKLRAQAERLGLPKDFLVMPSSERVEFSAFSDRCPLGSGEFCVAESATLRGERVALKLLRSERNSSELAISDLRREMTILSEISRSAGNGGDGPPRGHPHIVRLVAHGYTPTGSPFCALELFTQPLSAALPAAASKKALKEWPLARGIAIGLQVATALDYIHDGFMPGYRVLHRDLKPSNVGLARRGGHERAMLADFGLLKIWKRGEDDGELRRLTGLTGSLRYMAPEVALSQPYNHKAEVFSWTSLLYHVLTLEKPFAKMDAKKFVLEACKNGMRCPLDKKWPAKLRAVMTEGWAGDPAARPDCRAVTEVLKTL